MKADSQARLQAGLGEVTALLEKHRTIETLTHRQEGPKRDLLESLVRRQNLAELHNRLRGIHPADLAYILESLPGEDRSLVWGEVDPPQAADVLLEVADTVRASLVEVTDRPRLVAILEKMDPEDLAYVSAWVDDELVAEASRALDERALTRLQASRAFAPGSVGQLMSPEVVTAREDQTLEETLRELRDRKELPAQTDSLFVVDARKVLRGSLPLKTLVVCEVAQRVAEAMRPDVVAFTPDDSARQAAKAFERYDLVTAPVVDERGKLLGRLTVDAVMDFIREESEREALKRAGLAGEEDLFAPVWASARNRWLWLSLNLVTAFLASRVIGLFEATIQQLVALATLMPIVASVGGNTGNQTVALVIRGLALDQVTPATTRHLLRKELTVSLLNGVVWGTVMGLFAYVLYHSLSLGIVMAAAILLNLVIAALVGLFVPLALIRMGRDPAQGASVLLTFTTDSMGFFLFLGLAQAFLL